MNTRNKNIVIGILLLGLILFGIHLWMTDTYRSDCMEYLTADVEEGSLFHELGVLTCETATTNAGLFPRVDTLDFEGDLEW